MKTVPQRLQELRAAMADAGCQAYILPSSDPHASEYAPAHYASWEYFSGFKSENSTLIVLPESAALWIDGRFFGAADAALAGTGVDSMHMGEKGVPTVEEFLKKNLTAGQKLGYCAEVMPVKRCRELQKAVAAVEAELLPLHLEDAVWTEDRPALPTTPAWLLEPKYAGLTAAEKLARLREKLAEKKCTAALVTRLDSVAWLLNLRAMDVEDTPYALAFCYVNASGAVLFMDASRLPAQAAEALAKDGVSLRGYEEMPAFLAENQTPETVLADPASLNAALSNALAGNSAYTVQELEDPIQMLKAVKSAVELACTREAHLDDAAAMVRFQRELEQRLAAGETLRETEIEPILVRYRAMSAEFLIKSFGTIAAYGPNAAMMHYAPTPGKDAAIEPRGFLLVDCGGTYRTGTTDITRTYTVGPLTEQEKQAYTWVLRCHIGVAMAVWKKGATGAELDMLARQPLWKQMLDYRCGTGHSVSHVGAVHEGPHGLHGRCKVPFEPGMVVTDEPGFYEEGDVGIRIENELVCVEAGETAYGKFYKFEPLTWVPIDLTPVLAEQLTDEEKVWLNWYHAETCKRLASRLNEEEAAWLAEKCRPLA